ncbi:hypothetical protein CAP31_08810 [Sulfuriferula sp. AH1]|uniref:restriction endonuclease subunit S n=1 Tax=Sulfuriferula sp. AH1 TaxID=1985873 RepID=UPI000B3B5124|nr:restriction endonuclease subunit S [Sulfuriferula sp. AH1]ARU31771.1 hypothetical protein CAP31_08810 [Sulfuriferula sp. AH1]
MSGKWHMARLGDCCKVVSGATPKTVNPEFWDGEIKWVTPKDISRLDVPYLTDTPDKITLKGFASCSTNMLPKGTVMVSSRAPIGNVAICGDEMCTNQGFKSLIPGVGVDSLYLYFCMKKYSERLAALGNGATFKEVSKSIVEDFEIPLPPLEEQKRIAAILDKAGSLRRKRQQAIQLADEFLRAVFLDMFGDPVANPKGWEMFPLGDLCSIRRGASPRPINDFLGGTVPWIRIGDATSGDDLYITETAKHVTEPGAAKSVRLHPGAFVFANCGVSLGFARILKIEGCIHDGWLAFEDFSKSIDQFYLLALINILTPTLRRMAPDGTQPNLNIGIMKALEIPLPPIEQQRHFSIIFTKAKQLKGKFQGMVEEADRLFGSTQDEFFGRHG